MLKHPISKLTQNPCVTSVSKTEKLFDLEDESNPLDDISDFEKTIDISGTEEFFLPKLESLNFHKSQPVVSSSSDESETLLDDDERYSVESLLGKGGMGKVWKVKDSELLRTVALKMLHGNMRLDPYEIESFIVEAQLTSQLQHPGIVPIYELNTSKNGAAYFTMREIQGEVFRAKIKAVRRVSSKTVWKVTTDGWNFRRLIEVLKDICQTLSYAHFRGVIHRDLKPENIMIGEYGEVLLVDWGIAKVITLGTAIFLDPTHVKVEASLGFIARRKDSVAGTPSYMAPEQIIGTYDDMGPQADIYSLGVILYEILMGRKPFSGPPKEIVKQKLHGEPVSIWKQIDLLEQNGIEHRPIPDELAKICWKCMQKSSKDRYQSTKEVMIALQSWLDGSQKEEKVMQILSEVQKKKNEIEKINSECDECRIDLEAKLQEGLLGVEFWNNWQSLQEKQEDIILLNEDCMQEYQRALIHSADVIDVYRGLIELEYKEYLDALTDMNYRGIKKIGRRIRLYLGMLPLNEQRYWENLRLVDSSSLYTQRIRGIAVDRKVPEMEVLQKIEEQQWVSIVGMAGIGKTHLAWLVSSKWCKQREIELIFCDVSTCTSSDLLVTTLMQHFNISCVENSSKKFLIEEIKQRGECVLIIDNAEHLSKDSIVFMDNMVRNSPELTLVVTSRRSLDSEFETSYRLTFMSYIEGVELFVSHAKRRRVDWALTQKNCIHLLKIIKGLNRLPLALKLAAGRISELSLKEIDQRLEKSSEILMEGDHSKEGETLQAAWSLSYSMLGDKEKDIFIQASIFSGSFTLGMVEFVAQWGAGSILNTLEVLVEDNLVLKESDERCVRYSMLRSVREYGRSLFDEDVKQMVQRQHALYFAKLFREYESAETEQELLFEQLVFEFSNFVEGARSDSFEDAKSCCLACVAIVHQQGPISLGHEIIEEFLCREDVFLENVVEIYTEWSHLYRVEGRVEKAKQVIHQISLAYLSRADDELEEFEYPRFEPKLEPAFQASEEEAASLLLKGQTHKKNVSRNLLKAFSHYVVLEDISKQSEILKLLLEQAERDGEYSVALSYGTRLEELISALDDAKVQTETANKMAVLLTRMGKEKPAILEYKRALSLAKSSADIDNEARIYCNLGILFQARGELDEALHNYQLSKSLFENLKKKSAIAVLLSNIGTVYKIQRNFEDAKEAFEQAIELTEETGQTLHQSIFEGNLGGILIELLDFRSAEIYLNKAIEGCASQASYASGALKSTLAVLLAKKGNFTSANLLLLDAEEELIEVKEEYGKFLCHKIEVYFLEHKFEQINDLFEKVEQLVNELQATETSELVVELRAIQNKIPLEVWITDAKHKQIRQEALIYVEKADIYLSQSQYSQAENYFNKAGNLFQVLRDIDKSSLIQERVALIYTHQGQIKKACLIYENLMVEYNRQGKLLAYARISNFLSGLYRQSAQFDKSLNMVDKSIEIFKKYKREIPLISVLDRKGLIHKERGEYPEALQAFHEAKAIAQKNKIIPGTVFGNMAGIYSIIGKLDEAINYTQQAVTYFQRKGDKNREALYLGNLALWYSETQKSEEAERIYREIIPLARELGTKINEGLFAGNFGDLLMNIGKYEEAESYFLLTIDILKERYALVAEIFSASYAKLTLLLGNKELAKTRIDLVNESLLGNMADELIKLKAKKAYIYHGVGEIEEGKYIVASIERLLLEHDFKEGSAVSRTVKEVQALYSEQ